MKCMSEKYGPELVQKHHDGLARFIKDDMKAKGRSGLEAGIKSPQQIDTHTQTADHNSKWFAEATGAQQKQLWLNLPPTSRKEPPYKDEDVDEYHKLIKHLDPYQLTSTEYIKHAYHHLEVAPGRWHKSIPKKAMDVDLRSKDISKAMFAHFQEDYRTTLRNVSI